MWRLINIPAFVAVWATVLLAPGCMPLFCIACERSLSVGGEVYEWLDPFVGASSVVFLDRDIPQGLQLKPLGAMEITLEPWLPRNRPTASDAAVHLMKAVSSPDGQFLVGGVFRPGSIERLEPLSALFVRHQHHSREIASGIGP